MVGSARAWLLRRAPDRYPLGWRVRCRPQDRILVQVALVHLWSLPRQSAGSLTQTSSWCCPWVQLGEVGARQAPRKKPPRGAAGSEAVQRAPRLRQRRRSHMLTQRALCQLVQRTSHYVGAMPQRTTRTLTTRTTRTSETKGGAGKQQARQVPRPSSVNSGAPRSFRKGMARTHAGIGVTSWRPRSGAAHARIGITALAWTG